MHRLAYLRSHDYCWQKSIFTFAGLALSTYLFLTEEWNDFYRYMRSMFLLWANFSIILGLIAVLEKAPNRLFDRKAIVKIILMAIVVFIVMFDSDLPQAGTYPIVEIGLMIAASLYSYSEFLRLDWDDWRWWKKRSSNRFQVFDRFRYPYPGYRSPVDLVVTSIRNQVQESLDF